MVYTLWREEENLTRMSADGYMKKNVLKRLFFHLFLKKKFQRVYAQTWQNLQQYCQGLLNEGKKHHNLILPNDPATELAA